MWVTGDLSKNVLLLDFVMSIMSAGIDRSPGEYFELMLPTAFVAMIRSTPNCFSADRFAL